MGGLVGRLKVRNLRNFADRVASWAFIKKAILYVLALAIPFSLENAADILGLNTGRSKSPLVSPVFLYQWAVTQGPRKPRAHFVRLVMIDPRTEPAAVTANEDCAKRDFVARLLQTVAAANPAVIVLDMYYP